MRIDIVTLFPEMIEHAASFGVTGRARERGLWQLGLWNPRDYATDNHRTVDDRPYGGGPGMVMMAAPLTAAIGAARDAQRAAGIAKSVTMYLSPAGTPLTQSRVSALAQAQDAGYVIVAGRYEGVDERLIAREIDCEIAVGEFVVSGGELPALMLMDAIARQLPGALNDAESAVQESFADGLLDWPQYTRPERYDDEGVPGVLLSGNHKAIDRWRRKQALGRTEERRPDLIARRRLTAEENDLLAEYRTERNAT
jgi:tRNA (guanine37-N1)-methyltransferase